MKKKTSNIVVQFDLVQDYLNYSLSALNLVMDCPRVSHGLDFAYMNDFEFQRA